MKILKFSIIAILLLFIVSCNKYYYIPGDKGVVVGIKKVENNNEVTIKIIKAPEQKEKEIDVYMTFFTNKQYNIDDVIYFTKIK